MNQSERQTISTGETAARLGITRPMVMYACRNYRQRIEGERAQGQDGKLTPRPNELACQWEGRGKHTEYSVYADSLPLYQASQFESEKRGWRPGRPRKKRETGTSEELTSK